MFNIHMFTNADQFHGLQIRIYFGPWDFYLWGHLKLLVHTADIPDDGM